MPPFFFSVFPLLSPPGPSPGSLSLTLSLKKKFSLIYKFWIRVRFKKKKKRERKNICRFESFPEPEREIENSNFIGFLKSLLYKGIWNSYFIIIIFFFIILSAEVLQIFKDLKANKNRSLAFWVTREGKMRLRLGREGGGERTWRRWRRREEKQKQKGKLGLRKLKL